MASTSVAVRPRAVSGKHCERPPWRSGRAHVRGPIAVLIVAVHMLRSHERGRGFALALIAHRAASPCRLAHLGRPLPGGRFYNAIHRANSQTSGIKSANGMVRDRRVSRPAFRCTTASGRQRGFTARRIILDAVDRLPSNCQADKDSGHRKRFRGIQGGLPPLTPSAARGKRAGNC